MFYWKTINSDTIMKFIILIFHSLHDSLINQILVNDISRDIHATISIKNIFLYDYEFSR